MSQGLSLSLIPLPTSLLTYCIAGTNPDSQAPLQDQRTEDLLTSAMLQNFLSGQNYTNEPEPSWKPVQYFFYGSLMDERKLTEVLRLTHPPVLRPASITGYSIKMWGPYPALVDGPPGNVVNGMAYEVQSEGHESRLARYETDAYRSANCFIKPASGGDRIVGKTFVWAKGLNDKTLRAGSFDIEAWKKARYGSR